MTPFPATETVAAYAAGTDHVLSTADSTALRSLVLDYLGVAVAGAVADEQSVRTLRGLVARADGRATVIAGPATAAAADAALVNAFTAHLMEFDDSTLNPVGHPSVTILPAVLAVGEEVHASGAELLTAYSVGLEVHARLGQAMGSPWSSGDPFLPIGTIGTIGAAVAAGRLLGLDAPRMANAIGLAAASAGQLTVGNGSHAKPYAPAQSAASAVRAAQLAAAGFTGPETVVERPGGFADTFLRATDDTLAAALSRLGGPTHLSEVGVAIKRYPSCYGCHFSVDGLRQVMAAHDLDGTAIRGVHLTYPADSAFLDDPRPDTVERARFSLQFNLAVTLLDQYPKPEHFEPAALTDPRVLTALNRITSDVHGPDVPTPDCWRHTVAVTTASGETLVGAVPRPHGHPRDPLTPAEVRAKFTANLAYAGRGDVAETVAELVARLDGLADVGELTAALGGDGRHP